MSDKNKYYMKILDAWIAKMKDRGFNFKRRKTKSGTGFELEYYRNDGNTNICLIADYTTPVDQLFDRLHKLELLIRKLDTKPKSPILSVGLGYFTNYYGGPHLITRSTDLPNNKRYFTYIDNGKFKTIVGNVS